MCHWLSPKDALELAYQCATKFKVSFPLIGLLILLIVKIGCQDLFREILFYQYQDEPTSLVMATSFNATAINSLLHKLSAVIDRHAIHVHVQASGILNLDETGVGLKAEQRPSKVIER